MKKRLSMVVSLALAACLALMLGGCSEGYEPQLGEPAVSAEALADPGVLTVGVDASSYPFAGESKGRIVGYNVDVAAAVADELGLRLELVDTGMNGIAALGQGVDLLMGVDSSEVSGEACWLSPAYAPAAVAVFAADPEAPAPQADGQTVIGAQSSSLASWAVVQYYGAEALKSSIDLKEIFQGVKDGADAYAAADAVVGSYLANRLGMDTRIAGLLKEPGGYCMGVSGSNFELQEAVANALAAIQANGVMGVIDTRWLGGTIDVSAAELVPPVQAELDRQRQAEEEARAAEEVQAEEAPEDAGQYDEGAFLEVGANAVTEG